MFQLAEKDEFEHKQQELEEVFMPIVTKLYQGARGAPGGPLGSPEAGASADGWRGSTVDEVD